MNAEIALFLIQDGLTNGAIYALLALALVLVFAVTRVIFIPQGEFVAYGALTLASLQLGKLPGTAWLLLGAGLAVTAVELVQALRLGRIRRIPGILFNYAVVPAYATQFERAGFVDEVQHFQNRWAARDREGALEAISDDWVDAIQIMGDEQHVRDAVQAYTDHGVDVPIVFALPWGEDRRATVSATLRALA